MNCYFIALPSEERRIALLESWLRKTPLNFMWMSAKKGDDDLYGQYKDDERRKRYGFPMSPAEVGCFLSHQLCWHAVADNGETAIILESDASPTSLDSFVRLIDYLALPSVANSFDIVRLSGVFPHNEKFPRVIQSLEGFQLIQPLGDPMGSAAYVVTPDAARKLIDCSKEFFVPLDVFLGSTWKHHLRVRSLRPYPIETLDCESVIGDRRRPKQSKLERVQIEFHRAYDDIKRILYIPFHYWR